MRETWPIPRAMIGALAALAVPALLAGQVIQGSVIDHQDERPLAGARIVLVGETDRTISAISNQDGRFMVEAPSAGTWRIRVEMLGYEMATSDEIEVGVMDFVTVQVRMAVAPVRLDEQIVVTGVQSFEDTHIAEFHRRRVYGERSGFGNFLHGEELERRPGRPSDIVRTMPGVSSTTDADPMAGGGAALEMRHCFPDVYVDGLQINEAYPFASVDHFVTRDDIAAIEVYNGAQQPEQYRDPTGCGVVLVWTKNDAQDNPFTWPRFVIGIGLFVGVVAMAVL